MAAVATKATIATVSLMVIVCSLLCYVLYIVGAEPNVNHFFKKKIKLAEGEWLAPL